MAGLIDVGSGCQEVVAVAFVREATEEEKGRESSEELKAQQKAQTYQEIGEGVSLADSLALLLTPLF